MNETSTDEFLIIQTVVIRKCVAPREGLPEVPVFQDCPGFEDNVPVSPKKNLRDAVLSQS